MVIVAICVTIAMYCLIQFYIQLREDLKDHSPFLKILSIKLVIFLSFWQTVSQVTAIYWKTGRPSADIYQDPYILPDIIWRYKILGEDQYTGYKNWHP